MVFEIRHGDRLLCRGAYPAWSERSSCCRLRWRLRTSPALHVEVAARRLHRSRDVVSDQGDATPTSSCFSWTPDPCGWSTPLAVKAVAVHDGAALSGILGDDETVVGLPDVDGLADCWPLRLTVGATAVVTVRVTTVVVAATAPAKAASAATTGPAAPAKPAVASPLPPPAVSGMSMLVIFQLPVKSGCFGVCAPRQREATPARPRSGTRTHVEPYISPPPCISD